MTTGLNHESPLPDVPEPEWITAERVMAALKTAAELAASHDRLLKACESALFDHQHSPKVEKKLRAAIKQVPAKATEETK